MESLEGSWYAVKARDPRVIRKAARGMLAEGWGVGPGELGAGGKAGGKISGSGVKTPGAGLQGTPGSPGRRRGRITARKIDYWCAV